MRKLQYLLWSIFGFIVTVSVTLLYYAIIAQSDFWGERLPGLIFLNIIVSIGLAIGASAAGDKAKERRDPYIDPDRRYLVVNDPYNPDNNGTVVKGRVIEQGGYARAPGNPVRPGRYED